ncbi:MAG: glycine oxidase ThiO [Anaerolineales bacterium]|nr:glycine oxidase ThiO [Anaerolineales bacterium]
MADVIVIGAGIIGAACAWRLAQAGVRVTLLERTAPAAGASQAALGVLQFHAMPGAHPAYQHLSLRSRELYPAWLAELAETTGERVPYFAGGQLKLAFAEADWPELEALLAANEALGLPVERAGADECLLLEPALNPTLLGGVFLPADAWVDNTALTLALAKAAQRAGACLERVAVTAIEQAGGRVTGVRAAGQHYAADWVVLAAGCWSSQIAGVPALPVQPVRGQALAVAGRPVRHVVASSHGYLVPKTTEQTLVGATVEAVGYDEATTLGGLAQVAAAGLEISPRLAGGAFLGAWAGLRPATPDGRPCLGPFAALPNLIAAAGHFRNGILQAPATAEIVCVLVAGAPLAADISGLNPDREGWV